MSEVSHDYLTFQPLDLPSLWSRFYLKYWVLQATKAKLQYSKHTQNNKDY